MSAAEKKIRNSESTKMMVTSRSANVSKEREIHVPKSGKLKVASVSLVEHQEIANDSKSSTKGGGSTSSKRRIGVKGAAPWAARHAAKHAAEARARSSEPPLPGSARATLRAPAGANELKEKLNELLRCMNHIRVLRKNLNKNFYEIGELLCEIQDRKLFEARGYPTFDAFLERETEVGKDIGLRFTRIIMLFTRQGALELGLDKLTQMLGSLEQVREYPSESKIPLAPPRASMFVEPSGRAF